MKKIPRPAMTETRLKRLPKAERREQLLDTALMIVREQGTDALTLGYLAERAGVSKPIAYEHFETRSGLLMALYRRLDDQHAGALEQALGHTRPRLTDIARVVGHAYMECYESLGPEYLAISAALRGDEAMEAFQQRQLDEYVLLYCKAFAPYAKFDDPERLRLVCTAIVGAAEAISREMARGRVDKSAAAECLAALIVRSLR